MTKHLYGLIVTSYGVAANNRGESEGNITTLQKILWNGEVHTTVSAEAIRWAVRYQWQKRGIEVNRRWAQETNDNEWRDPAWLSWTDPEGEGKDRPTYIDDDVLGFMVATAASTEGNEDLDAKKEEQERVKAALAALTPEDRRKDQGRKLTKEMQRLNREVKALGKGTATKRRGALEVSRAISLAPFAGDITFNAKSGEKTNTSLYGTEVHATRYQYAFAVTPDSLRQKERILDVVDAFVSLSEVGGNQSRFLYDFAPEAVVFRWTDDFAPRILYGFSSEAAGRLTIPSIIRKVETGDIDPAELVTGGDVEVSPAALGALTRHVGVKAAADEIKARIASDLHL